MKVVGSEVWQKGVAPGEVLGWATGHKYFCRTMLQPWAVVPNLLDVSHLDTSLAD